MLRHERCRPRGWRILDSSQDSVYWASGSSCLPRRLDILVIARKPAEWASSYGVDHWPRCDVSAAAAAAWPGLLLAGLTSVWHLSQQLVIHILY